jgi:hypothetical protein
MASARRTTSAWLTLALLAATVAAPALATNTGFKQTIILEAAAVPTLHWLSLPFRYLPADVGLPATVDAEDLCQDLDGDGVEAVLRWDEPTSTFVEHTCGSGGPFPLDEGIGYGVRVAPDWSIRAHLSGGHDDGFSYLIPPSGGSQLQWLSLPYHLQVPERPADVELDAEDLCRQIDDADVLAIVRWNGEIGAYESHGCGSAFTAPFEIVRGQAYGVVNRSQQTIGWQPAHF